MESDLFGGGSLASGHSRLSVNVELRSEFSPGQNVTLFLSGRGREAERTAGETPPHWPPPPARGRVPGCVRGGARAPVVMVTAPETVWVSGLLCSHGPRPRLAAAPDWPTRCGEAGYPGQEVGGACLWRARPGLTRRARARVRLEGAGLPGRPPGGRGWGSARGWRPEQRPPRPGSVSGRFFWSPGSGSERPDLASAS